MIRTALFVNLRFTGAQVLEQLGWSKRDAQLLRFWATNHDFAFRQDPKPPRFRYFIKKLWHSRKIVPDFSGMSTSKMP